MAVPVCIETPTRFARFKVADATAIPLSTMLKLSGADLYAEATTNVDGELFAGIAWEEKTANDGVGEIVVAKNGVWDITSDVAGVSSGGIVALSGANIVRQAAAADLLNGSVVGKALEAGTSGEVIRVLVGEVI